MHAKLALVAALTGSAIAAMDLRPDRVRRDLLPRQTDIPNPSADSCLSALATVYANAPTPPPKIVSYEMTAAPQTDPCSVTYPSELSAEYSSYTSAVISWVNANSASINSALSQCSTVTDFATEIASCSATGKVGSKATGSASGGAAGSAAATKTPNAGPRETGMVGAVVAAAGLVGAALL
ncbi:infection structure specific protein [Colletotrichum truncatum]|uniref:Infection structure specific protein n=1 Tax=Colletotrichum truncatum TaxID=5467 RepID=A0ACC3YFH6_COLTU|nr:infection structure specific protein [Colletotrichum truncatum]KAF6788324.1 infection structure specific protein [Colletotrichum truncatum]